MVRIALALLVSAGVGGCDSVDGDSALGRAVARINSGSGIQISTPYGGGALGTNAQRERAERNTYGWGGRPLGGVGALRDGPTRHFYGVP